MNPGPLASEERGDVFSFVDHAEAGGLAPAWCAHGRTRAQTSSFHLPMRSALLPAMHRAAGLAALLALLLCTACGGSLPGAGAPRREFRADSVSARLWDDVDLASYQALPNPFDLAGMTPSRPAEYLELRRHMNLPEGRGGILHQRTTGTLCGGATDGAACRAAYEAVETRGGFLEQCLPSTCVHSLISTHGNEVRAWNTREEAATFLAPIDTPVEAAFIARIHPYYWDETDRTANAAIRADGDGFLLLLPKLYCDGGSRLTRHLVRVSRNGELALLRRQVVEVHGEECPVS